MMEGSKRFEDAALRGITRHHVWKSRTSDLTVINLRDPTELLGTPEVAAESAPVAAVVAAAVATPIPAAAAAAAAAVAASTPAAAATAEVRRPVVVPTPPPTAPAPRPTTGKQESVSALLSKLRLGSPATEAAGAAKSSVPSVTPPAAAAAPVVVAAASPAPPVHAPAPTSAAAGAAAPLNAAGGASASAAPTPYAMPAPMMPSVSVAPSPPVRAAEPHQPTFPDLRESSSTAAVSRFEFITGTNIPGQGVVKKADPVNESSSMALFHDPLWGGGSLMDAFATPPPVKKSPQPQPRASLAELYGTATPASTAATTAAALTTTATAASVIGGASVGGIGGHASGLGAFRIATPPAVMHTPVASPPVSTVAANTPVQAPMPPQQLQTMNEMVSAPAPQLATSYPMYTMPLQYVPQPQFPGGVVYNSAFFPYGATAMMLPQQMTQQLPQPMAQQLSQQLNHQLGQPMGQPMPQQFPQGFQMASAAVMRPGTNVKAMPFVPGSTM